MDKERLLKLAGIEEDDKNRELFEGNVTTRLDPGPNFDAGIWRKTYAKGSKEMEVHFNFSSFKVSHTYTAKDSPDDIDERHDWEQAKSVELAKKATPLVKKFVADLEKLLKQVK